MKRRINFLMVLIFLACVAGIFLISPKNRASLQSGFLTVISPFLKKGSEWDSSFREYRGRVKKLHELEAENAKWKTEVEGMRAENQALRGVERENIRLRDALGYKNQAPFSLVAARVVGRPVTNWWHSLQVDKGSLDGIEVGMPVLTPDGLVGKIIMAGEHVATVLLITDEKCQVAASVEGTSDTSMQGVVHVEVRGERASSNLQPRMVLKFVSKYARLEPGVKIITSGAGQVYPPGVVIGRVIEFKPRELDGEATLEPAVDLATLSDVFIVTGMKASVQSR